MKAQDFRHMDTAALQTEAERRRKELLEMRCQVALGEDVRPHQIKALRREVARIETVLKEQERAAVAAGDNG